MTLNTNARTNEELEANDAGYCDNPASDQHGRKFLEVVIHPFVEMIADEDGEPVDDGEWTNASGGEYSDEFGDDLDDYPNDMFRKGWSVSSWVEHEGDLDVVDEEEFDDRASALARSQELAALYRVPIDHRY